MKKTGMWFQFHPEADLIRMNIQNEGGTGNDVDVALADLPTEIQDAAVHLHALLADYHGAEPFIPEDSCGEEKAASERSRKGRKPSSRKKSESRSKRRPRKR